MKLLGVNIDHIATIRKLRQADYPDLLEAAETVRDAGADSITVHLRQDRRHIQEDDVIMLIEKIDIPLNLEIAVTDEMVNFAVGVKPAACCLVPERPGEVTTEGGLDVIAQADLLQDAVARLMHAGILVSLFIDPEPDQIAAAKKIGAPVIELHTGAYAYAGTDEKIAFQLNRIKQATQVAFDLGLQINAGHALSYNNTQAICAIPQIGELNIGHAIIARALTVGLSQAVREMAEIVHA
jgi:pyridoxine 5-phosphate synthase